MNGVMSSYIAFYPTRPPAPRVVARSRRVGSPDTLPALPLAYYACQQNRRPAWSVRSALDHLQPAGSSISRPRLLVLVLVHL
jgi:hypothetical protein